MTSAFWEFKERDQAYGSRKVKVTILASEWGLSKGGLSTISPLFTRELAIQLAKFPDVEITYFLLKCSKQDKKEALGHKINIVEATWRPGFEELEWLTFPPEHLQIDVIVGQGVKLGRQAQMIRDSHKCKWVQVVQTDPYPISKDERKRQIEVELCAMADFVVGLGSKPVETFCSFCRWYHKDPVVLDLTPGLFDEFLSFELPDEKRGHCSILVFGRGDEDFTSRGINLVGRAVALLPDTQLVFLGAPDGKIEEIAQRLLECGISDRQLIVRGYPSSRDRLRDMFCAVDMVLMPSTTEGFGLTGLEALSAGLPVLISKNSGFGEALSKVPSGLSLVIDSEDPKVWATAIKDIWSKDRQTRLEEAKLLRSSYNKIYSWAKQSKVLLEKMFNLVHGSSSRFQSSTNSEHRFSSPPAWISQHTDVATELYKVSLDSSQKETKDSEVKVKMEDVRSATKDVKIDLPVSLESNQKETVDSGVKMETEDLLLAIKDVKIDEPELENIVTATKKFEAEHEECLRVLPYKHEDRVVVHFYVFSGESGIPERLKKDAEMCFGERVRWSDMYNDAAEELNVTPIVYPFGKRKALKASQVDHISEIINKHLRVFDEHRNITSVQPSFKITESKQTEKPCIAIYVLGKGYVPIGETEFPRTVGPYVVDVVDGFWYTTRDPWEPNKAQKQSEVLCLGASIGVNGEEASGTLGSIVEDENSGTFYVLSCDHVIEDKQKSGIIHPGLNDHLNYLKYHLSEYRKWIDRITEPDCPETRSASLQGREMWSEKFEKLKATKEKYRDSDRSSEETLEEIDKHEKSLERGFKQPPRVVGEYVAGVRDNVKWTDGKEYFIDAAIAKLTADEVKRLRKSKTARMIGTGDYPSGTCSPATTTAILSAEELCKSGRTTGYTTGRLVVDAPSFLKPPAFRTRGDEWVDVGKHSYLCQKCAEARPTPPQMTKIDKKRSCDACKDAPAVVCEEGLWLKNCLCIESKRTPFADEGDSGAVIFERGDGNQSACLSGFGLIFAAHENAYKTYAIASPLEVVLKVLSQEISKESTMRVVSEYSA